MPTTIIRDELGNRKPMLRISLPSDAVDADGSPLSGVPVYVPASVLIGSDGLPVGPARGLPVALTQGGAYGIGAVTIAASATRSDAIAMASGGRLAGLLIPAAFTGTAISLSVSLDGSTFGPFRQAGATVSVPVTAGDAVDLLGILPGLVAWPYVAIISNASEAALRSIGYVTV